MKIGVILDTEYSVDIRVLNEVSYLSKIGHELHILCPSFENQLLYESLNGVTIHRFKISKSIKNKLFGIMNTLPLYEYLWIYKVKKFIDNVKPECLHSHDLFMSKIAYKGGNGKLPVILDLHENFPSAIQAFRWATRFPHRLISRPGLWQKKELEYLLYASRIIVLDSTFRETLLQKYPVLNRRNFYIYPNVPDLERMNSYPINNNIFPKKGRFILFYFGGIAVRRGILTCFEALKILLKDIPTVHLLLIGPIDQQERTIFNQYLNNPSLKEKVTHFEWKDISELPSYVLASDICISPIIKDEQHDSGVANKVFQYMLFQRPIIVSNCTPQIKIVNNCNCGLIFESENAKDLAKKIKYLYVHPSIRLEMGQLGKNFIQEEYNLSFCGKQLDLLYKSFIND